MGDGNSKAEQSTTVSVHVQSISNDFVFAWLDKSIIEYPAFKNSFCEVTNCDQQSWHMFQYEGALDAFIRTIVPPKKLVLVTTGRLAQNTVPYIHNLEQLHSVYIFCRNVPIHEQWSKPYTKVRGVFNDSRFLLSSMGTRLAVEAQGGDGHAQGSESQPILLPGEAAAIAATPPVQSRGEPRADEADVDWFAQPGTHWCPWNSNSCTKTLFIHGQGTIEIMELERMPFQLQLSNKQDPNDQTAYTIVLTVNQNEAKLSAKNVVLDVSTDPHHILQPDDGKWHTYWLSIFKETRQVKYGIGETRLNFTIFNYDLAENDVPSIRELYYLHIKMNNNNRMLADLGESRMKFRFFIGKDPIVYDPPLIVVPQSNYTLEHAALHTAIAPSKLEKPCRDLYDSIANFTLNDDTFPDFVRAIERSLTDPKGWCHTKLIEKANRFGRPNLKVTYLRITVGKPDGQSPGHTYVIEIWPPGHYSPVHNHSNAYGIIRILYGRILVKLYPALTLSAREVSPIEQILEEGQVTWMLPKLNQTHQVKNPDLYGKCCITLQCYQYGQEDRQHYEYFDYLSNDGRSIGHFDPKSDMDFMDFKHKMRQEWQAAS